MIHLILNPDPELRPTIQEILEHSFFTCPSDGMPLEVLPRSFPKTFLNYPLSEDFTRSLKLRAASSDPNAKRYYDAFPEPNSFAVEEIPPQVKRPYHENLIQHSEVTKEYPRVNLWLAYPHYGIGYLLSNGSVGELMPDKTSLFYTPCAKHILYNNTTAGQQNLDIASDLQNQVPHGRSLSNNPSSSSPTVLPQKKQKSKKSQLECFPLTGLKTQEEIQQALPPDIFKKQRLLRRFKREFKYRIVRDRTIPSYFLQFENGVYQTEKNAENMQVENEEIKYQD